MINKKIDLYESFGLVRKEKQKGYLTTYAWDVTSEIDMSRKFPSVIVCGGGGYGYVSEREKECVALKFLSYGFNAYTIDYSVAPCMYPDAVIEVSMAISYIREHADELHTDVDHVAVIGFSAGGHLAACMATIYDDKNIAAAIGSAAKTSKPNAVILSYPVISNDEKISHKSSLNNLCGGDEKLADYLSLEKRVGKKTVPTFLWHTANDGAVNVMNSVVFAQSMFVHHVPCELHVFESGVHGLALATDLSCRPVAQPQLNSSQVAVWFDLAISWLQKHGFQIK